MPQSKCCVADLKISVFEGSRVKVVWIKGHAGDSGNEASHKAANEGHLSEIWSFTEDEHYNLLCHAKINDTIVEDDMRRVLKRQSVIRNNAAEWDSNIYPRLESGGLEGDFERCAQWADSKESCHQLCRLSETCKKIYGIFPTLSYMRKWLPNLYDTDICRMCELEAEDIKHIWRCATSRGEQMEGWDKAAKEVNDNGQRAWAKERKQRRMKLKSEEG
ncbi:hypothetical protein EDD11_007486 [Mortierella claussenii]|nr:hypothetical protein EDD11_007486 [Mortierella claussenii]